MQTYVIKFIIYFPHLSSLALGPTLPLYNGYLFRDGKAAGEIRWPPTQSSAEVKESVEVYLYFLFGPS